jgi:hypothetical protein
VTIEDRESSLAHPLPGRDASALRSYRHHTNVLFEMGQGSELFEGHYILLTIPRAFDSDHKVRFGSS